MSYSVVYSTKTGNTKLLADTVKNALPEKDCVYFGTPSEKALAADKIYIGFWTNMGSCDSDTAAFLKTLSDKEVFLFGSAGFGESQEYFDNIIKSAEKNLPAGNTVTGSFMCQGKMPHSVRARYEKMEKSEKTDMLIRNFDAALSHPDGQDLENLKKSL